MDTRFNEPIPSRASGESSDPGVGVRAALVFALLAHRLSVFYEHGHWMSGGQAAALCSEWVARRRLSIAPEERKQLVAASEELSSQMRESLSREAGLYASHELMEALDARYESELGRTVMDDCVLVVERLSDDGDALGLVSSHPGA